MPPVMTPTLSAALILGWLGFSGNATRDHLLGRPANTTNVARTDGAPIVVPLDDEHGIILFGTKARAVRYQAVKAVELTAASAHADSSLGEVALLDRPDFGDGTIELW